MGFIGGSGSSPEELFERHTMAHALTLKAVFEHIAISYRG